MARNGPPLNARNMPQRLSFEVFGETRIHVVDGLDPQIDLELKRRKDSVGVIQRWMTLFPGCFFDIFPPQAQFHELEAGLLALGDRLMGI